MRDDETLLHDRRDAGRRLAGLLHAYKHAPGAIVLGLPRGGVPVAAEIASVLGLPLDLLIVRKLGVPGFEELAFGAISSGDIAVLNQDVIRKAGIDDATVERIRTQQTAELNRREVKYRGGRTPLVVRDATVIVVDDGTATGATMHVALDALREARPRRVIVAVGVAPRSAIRRLRKVADDVVVLLSPRSFTAVGAWYNDFTQTTDDEVIALISKKA